MIIGVTGTIGSGKGTFCKALVKEGFIKLAFGDEVRKEADKRGVVGNREKLQLLGFSARQKDVNVWSKRIAKRIELEKNYVIDGYRYPDQVEFFRNKFGDGINQFQLVVVDALEEYRFDRLKKRGREGDPQTWAEFWVQNGRDWVGYVEGTGQDVRGCVRMADYTMWNDHSLNSFVEGARCYIESLRMEARAC